MCTTFLIFKSVATLVMFSAILVMIVTIIFPGIAVYLDFSKCRLKPLCQYDLDWSDKKIKYVRGQQPPQRLARDIAENLRSALVQFSTIYQELEEE